MSAHGGAVCRILVLDLGVALLQGGCVQISTGEVTDHLTAFFRRFKFEVSSEYANYLSNQYF